MEKQKTFTINELAEMYNVSTRTIYTWIRPIRKELLKMNKEKKKRLRILLPRQVKMIIEFLG